MASVIHNESSIVLSDAPTSAIAGLQADTLYAGFARDSAIYYSTAPLAPTVLAGYQVVHRYNFFHFRSNRACWVRTESGAGRLALAEVTSGREITYEHENPFALTVANAEADTGLDEGHWVFRNTGDQTAAWASADNAPTDLNHWFLVPPNGGFTYCNDGSPLTLWARALQGTTTLLPSRVRGQNA